MAVSSAFAGSWGTQKLQQLGKSLPSSTATTYRDEFGDVRIKDYKAKCAKTHHRFKELQDNNTMILTYVNKEAHVSSSGAGESRSAVIGEERSLSSSSYASSTTTMPEQILETAPLAMVRTQGRLLRTDMAPIAVGRSGHRMEKGINASGLLGERLQVSEEPTRNSFVQRSWLPYDDPALLFKINGKPEAFMPNDVSLDIGNHNQSRQIHWQNGRKFAANPLSKSRRGTTSVFMDD